MAVEHSSYSTVNGVGVIAIRVLDICLVVSLSSLQYLLLQETHMYAVQKKSSNGIVNFRKMDVISHVVSRQLIN